MQSLPRKACKYCNDKEPKHWPFQCPKRPKQVKIVQRTPVRKIGKKTQKWLALRKEWLREHPDEYFQCTYCPAIVPRSEVTLDHYKSRSRHPELVFDRNNLVPACGPCNDDKGSMDGDEYILRKYGGSDAN